MKQRFNIVTTSLFVAFVLSSCQPKVEESQDHSNHSAPESTQEKKQEHNHKENFYYTCSMHPEIKEDKPGKCPICHMNLTKVLIEDESTNSTNANIDGSSEQKAETIGVTAQVKLRKSQLSHFKPSFFSVTKMMMEKNIRLLGSVMQSEDRESNIPARIAGRVESVFIKSTGSLVKEGQAVLELYSPKLITAGEEYIIARKSYLKNQNKEFKNMLSQSEERLKLWGIRPEQYETWYKEAKIPKAITIYSPATGIVRKKNAIIGKYFNEGENFFELSDLSEVWVELDVYEQDAALINLSQKVKMEFSSLPGTLFEGEIDFINPILDSNSRTLKVRTTIKNSTGKLRPGMVADANLSIQFDGMALVIPRSAIIDTGKRKVVWMKVSDSTYQAKVILTGHESGGYVEVKEGLLENEEVVMDGNFLLDAQAQLFGGYE